MAKRDRLGRAVLQRILRGRLTFTPQIDRHSGEMAGYNFEGPTRFDKLFSGIAISAPRHVDGQAPNTSGPRTPSRATTGGRLLDRFYKNNAEGMASPTGLEYIYTLVGATKAA